VPKSFFSVRCNCNMKRILFLLLFILCTSQALFAGPTKKVLVYYFKNISGENRYSELMYKLPVCFYTNMKERMQDSTVSLIGTEGLDRYSNDPTYNLWGSELILEIAQQSGIAEVIYGQFYVKDGRPVVFGKVYFIQSGVILDISEDQEEYYEILQQIETLSVEQVMTCSVEEKEKVYSPGIRRIVERKVISLQNNLLISGGAVFPISDWHDLFPVGFSGELFYSIFPKMDLFPLGFGAHTGFFYFKRDANEYYNDSEMFLFPIGVQVRYIVKFEGFVDGISGDFSAGGCITRLFVNENLSTSIDPYFKVGLNLIMNPLRGHHISLKFGYMNVAYMDTSLSLLTGELGIVFYF
jgi:hypothetical protein